MAKNSFNKLVESLPDYQLLTPYIRSDKKVTFKHLRCGTIWEVRPTKFEHQDSRCPVCSKYDRLEKYRNKFHKLLSSLPDYLLLTPYIDSKTKVKIKHLICGTVWEVTPAHFRYDGSRCPTCCNSGISSLEKTVAKILRSLGIDYLREYRFKDLKDKQYLPFDFALLDDKGKVFMLLEIDGKQHSEPLTCFGGEDEFEIRKKHDLMKENYCKDKGYQFKRITRNDLTDLV